MGFYKISSSSMEPTLLPGDYVLVDKLSYGARIIKPIKLIFKRVIEYYNIRGFDQIKREDILTFNKPNINIMYHDLNEDCLVKRCIGLPGDKITIYKDNSSINSIYINGNKIQLMGNVGVKINLFPFDTTLNWTLGNYGPIYVPKKGENIIFNTKTLEWYQKIISFENPISSIIDSTLNSEDKPLLSYTFKHNYYFMIGDNFYFSNDSRHWGFVQDENIIGKVIIVIFSIDSEKRGFKKIRWNRILRPFISQTHEFQYTFK